MIGLLLATLPNPETARLHLDPTTMRESISALVDQFGPLVTLSLAGLLIQALLPIATHDRRAERVVFGIQGALLAASIAIVAGAAPLTRPDSRLWIVALAIMLALVEAKATSTLPTMRIVTT